MRTRVLQVVAVTAMVVPLAITAVGWRDRARGSRQLEAGLTVLDVPIERAGDPADGAARPADLVRAQGLFSQSRVGSEPNGPVDRRTRSLWHAAQAWLDLSRGELVLADQEADTAHRLFETEPRSTLVLAAVALRRGDRGRAEPLLSRLSDDPRVPSSVRARAGLLRIGLLLDSGREHDALTVAEALDRDHSRSARAANLLGLARAAVGDPDGAREAFGRAATLDPGDAAPLVNLARLERDAGDRVAARATLERALAIVHDSAEAWLAYGVVLAELRAPEARHALVHAGELSPDESAPWNAQGELDLAEGNTANAIESFRNALARSADDATAQTNLGVAFARAGRYDDALTAFDRATRLAPHQGEAWNGLGAMRLARGDGEGAVGPLEQAVVLLPRDANPCMNLGRALEGLQRFDEAARAFRQALDRSPGLASALEHLLRLAPPAHRARLARQYASR